MSVANPTFEDLMHEARTAFEIASRAREQFIRNPEDDRALDSWTWWSKRSARMYGGARANRRMTINNRAFRARHGLD